jgi:hypothetical protein
MAKGNGILVTPEPKGVFEDIIISGTPKPGVVMERTSTALVGGRATYNPAGTTAASGSRGMSADGDRIGICVLLEDWERGITPDTAYASGDRARIYWPVNGEEMNMLFQDNSGTADDIAINDKLIVDDGTGKVLLSASTPESEPFIALEAIVDPVADQLLWCKYIGM